MIKKKIIVIIRDLNLDIARTFLCFFLLFLIANTIWTLEQLITVEITVAKSAVVIF